MVLWTKPKANDLKWHFNIEQNPFFLITFCYLGLPTPSFAHSWWNHWNTHLLVSYVPTWVLSLSPSSFSILSVSCTWSLFHCQRWSHSTDIHSSHLSRALGLHIWHNYNSQGYEHTRQSTVRWLNPFDATHHRGTLRYSRCHITFHASRGLMTPLASGYCGPKLVYGFILGSRTWHCWSFDFETTVWSTLDIYCCL